MKIKALLYCTKQPHKLYTTDKGYVIADCELGDYYSKKEKINGKIVGECDFEVEKIDTMALSEHTYDDYYNDNIDRISKESCLTCEQMCKYLGTTWDSIGYAIHIKNLHIFDEPRDIRNYYNIAPRTMQDCMNQRALVKASQNMCNAYDVYKNHYILISIQPQEMCRIANKEQTTLIKKAVLKEMLNNE